MANKTPLGYWQCSRQLSVSLLFVLPLWLCYELLAFRLNLGLDGNLRTGVDYLIRLFWMKLSLPLLLSLMLPIALLFAFFYRSEKRGELARLRMHHIGLMFLESLVYALCFGLLIGHASGLVLQASPLQMDVSRVAVLAKHLGSGVFEELIFRVAAIGLFIFILRKLVSHPKAIYSIAVVSAAILFALFHYLAIFGETFTWQTFVFRFMAGIAFSILFLVRGYGITAYTHSLYNVFLMFR